MHGGTEIGRYYPYPTPIGAGPAGGDLGAIPEGRRTRIPLDGIGGGKAF